MVVIYYQGYPVLTFEVVLQKYFKVLLEEIIGKYFEEKQMNLIYFLLQINKGSYVRLYRPTRFY